MSEIDYAALILRCWVGVVMLAHGINHARSLEGTSRWFAKVGFRSPDLNARLSAFNEIAVGVILIAGFLTPVAAAAVAGTMLVAFWSIHRFAGFFVFRRPDEGYEYVATLAVAALVIAIVGAGRVSVDRALGWAENMDGWVGAMIWALGVVIGAGQLALFWRRPIQEVR
jgi:putative oxidoreductase